MHGRLTRFPVVIDSAITFGTPWLFGVGFFGLLVLDPANPMRYLCALSAMTGIGLLVWLAHNAFHEEDA